MWANRRAPATWKRARRSAADKSARLVGRSGPPPAAKKKRSSRIDSLDWSTHEARSASASATCHPRVSAAARACREGRAVAADQVGVARTRSSYSGSRAMSGSRSSDTGSSETAGWRQAWRQSGHREGKQARWHLARQFLQNRCRHGVKTGSQR